MKLLIAVPTLDFMHYEFVESLTNLMMQLHKDGVDYGVKYIGGTLVYIARDKMVREAIDGGYTHVLWFDADMVFQPTILNDLLLCGKDFVTGIYHARRRPYNSCIFKNLHPVERFKEYPRAAFQIAACGFGCVLIKTEILRMVRNKYGSCFTPTRFFGEDIAFCEKCTEMGYEIWCEPNVKLGHIGHIPVYPDDVERLNSDITQ